MATVKILFDGGDVPVVMGAKPLSLSEPIANPVPAGGTTNSSFFALAGVHFYGLDTTIPYRPLWQKGRAIDGVPLELTFSEITNPTEMG